ncbi:MAG TPA: aldehyde dehydrogenase family protein, partial [Mobilitalea sp.]|nr:aldehyde dehydrogenase family protein [Mobilitalea sp.]
MEDIKAIIDKQREYYATGATRDVTFRIKQLIKLKRAIKNNESELLMALNKDLNKSEFEGYMTEIGMVYDEISYIVKSLPAWAKPKKVMTPIVHFPSQSRIYSEPYGIVLIMAPWNYPFQLAIEPLV